MSCCRGGSNLSSKRATKIFYLFIIILSVIASLVLRYYGSHMFVGFASFKFGCTGDGTSAFQEACFGNQAVFRISFALAVFFLLMMAASFSDTIDRGYWGLKFVLYVILVVVSFFIPNAFFNSYADVARVVSIVFLLLMVLILVDFAYNMQDYWMTKAGDMDAAAQKDGMEPLGLCNNGWRLSYLVLCFAMIITTMVGLISMYAFTSNSPVNCGTDNLAVSVTLVVGLVLTVGSTMTCGGETARGLMPGAVVWIYAAYLAWGALTSNPDKDCNPLGGTGDSPAQIVIGLAITALSLAYTAYSAADSAPTLCGGGNEEDESMSQGLLTESDALITTGGSTEVEIEAARQKAAAKREAAADGDEEMATDKSAAAAAAARSKASAAPADGEEQSSKGNWVFHLIMMTAGIYMAMLLTDWGAHTDATAVGNQGVSTTTMWVKIISNWLTLGLYAWTLAAPMLGPMCCPNRDFS